VLLLRRFLLPRLYHPTALPPRPTFTRDLPCSPFRAAQVPVNSEVLLMWDDNTNGSDSRIWKLMTGGSIQNAGWQVRRSGGGWC
jgi:hypothetical protein